jgi:uncharacterized protein YuzE
VKITYDRDADAFYVRLLEGLFQCDALRVTPTVALDFSGDDKLVGVEILGRSGVKVVYDSKADIVSVLLVEAPVVVGSEEARPGVFLDYDASGKLVSLEVVDASKGVTEPGKVEFQAM